jgi:hypothetical protein
VCIVTVTQQKQFHSTIALFNQGISLADIQKSKKHSGQATLRYKAAGIVKNRLTVSLSPHRLPYPPVVIVGGKHLHCKSELLCKGIRHCLG